MVRRLCGMYSPAAAAARIDLLAEPRGTSFSWDGQLLATPSRSKKGGIAIIAAANGKSWAEMQLPRLNQTGENSERALFSFSLDGRQLLVAMGREAIILDATTGKEVGRLAGHANNLSAAIYSPDGEQIATADEGGLIRIWNAKSFRPLSNPRGHRSMVTTAELSRDGKHLLTWARNDETVFVWDLVTGQPLRTFSTFNDPDQTGDSSRPRFTPDGVAIILSTKDRLIARDLQTGLEVPLPGEMAKLPLAPPCFLRMERLCSPARPING